MKFGLASIVLPPSHTGQAIALHNLLNGIDPGNYCLISQCYLGKRIDEGGNCTQRLGAPYHYVKRFVLDIENLLVKSYHGGIQWPLNRYTAWISDQIVSILTHEECTIAIGCSADLVGTYATFLAARRMDIPYVLYVFDDYEIQWIGDYQRAYAHKVASEMIRSAAAVIVPNEFLQKTYHVRYGVKPVVIRNSIDHSWFGDYGGIREAEPSKTKEKSIVYTGDIYEAHYDAFRHLIDAVQQIPDCQIKIHIYSRRSRQELERAGIKGPIVIHDAVPMEMMPGIQGTGDLLFLPLAFSSDLPQDIIKTSAPMKMGEYLASGKPVLVHAPEDTFVSWYFRENDVGIVVDSTEPEKLSVAIVEILTNSDLRKKVIRNARIKAQTDFSAASAQKRFRELLNCLDA